MIDENKVKMLTKIAKFEHETRKSRKELESLNRFKYVSRGVFWTVISTTIAFFAAIVLVSLLSGTFNENATMFLNGNLKAFANAYIWVPYIFYEVGFILIAIAFYIYKYSKLEKKLEEYLRRQSTFNEYYNRRNIQ